MRNDRTAPPSRRFFHCGCCCCLPSMSSQSVQSTATLPEAASHSYLGPGQSTIDNCLVLSPGEEYEILLYPIPDIVLFPGQTIPLRIQNRAFIHKFLTMRQVNNSIVVGQIGIVNISHFQNLRYGSLAKVGTTMEVRSTYRQSFNDMELVVSGKGRYRFFINNIRTDSGVPLATIRILPDFLPTFSTISINKNPFPQWVYDQYSPRRLARIAYSLFESTMLWEGKDNIINCWGLLRALNPNQSLWSMKNTEFPEYEAEVDPVGFSFFLSANIPVESSSIQILLEAECVVQRLRLAISLLRTGLHKKIACARCGLIIASKQALFNVSGAEGLAAVYVNRYGSVHQTLTLRTLMADTAVRYQGRPSTQDTWFPGYAWTIMCCSRCFGHLGWKYTWVGVDQDEEANSSLMSEDDDDDDDDMLQLGDDDDHGMDDDYVTIDDEDENEADAETVEEAIANNVDVENSSSRSFFSANSATSAPAANLIQTQPLECNRSAAETSESEGEGNSISQTVLQEFWGLTRAAIREV